MTLVDRTTPGAIEALHGQTEGGACLLGVWEVRPGLACAAMTSWRLDETGEVEVYVTWPLGMPAPEEVGAVVRALEPRLGRRLFEVHERRWAYRDVDVGEPQCWRLVFGLGAEAAG